MTGSPSQRHAGNFSPSRIPLFAAGHTTSSLSFLQPPPSSPSFSPPPLPPAAPVFSFSRAERARSFDSARSRLINSPSPTIGRAAHNLHSADIFSEIKKHCPMPQAPFFPLPLPNPLSHASLSRWKWNTRPIIASSVLLWLIFICLTGNFTEREIS